MPVKATGRETRAIRSVYPSAVLISRIGQIAIPGSAIIITGSIVQSVALSHG